MSAGTGIAHSEYNASKADPVHFLQIWLLPNQRGIAPSYEQKTFSADEKRGQLRVVASPDGRDGSVTIHTDATLYAGLFGSGQSARLDLSPGRHAWVHVARGNARVNGEDLSAGDAVALSGEAAVVVEGRSEAEAGEVLLFDLG
jgi:redox-sensitive bicupin YhaK (pirin superfamily)